jgi:hypothetical protein
VLVGEGPRVGHPPPQPHLGIVSEWPLRLQGGRTCERCSSGCCRRR